MAKAEYKVPPSLARSVLDYEIPITTKSFSLGVIPVKVLLFWFAVFISTAAMIMTPPVKHSPVWLKIIIVLWVIGFAAYFGQWTKTKEMKFMQLPALFGYLHKQHRRISTRRDTAPYPFMQLVGIKSVDEDGYVRYLDGRVGYFYSVVGTASALLFSGDRSQIVDRVDSFWQKVETDTQWNFITTKESQAVFSQVANVERKNQNLVYRHPELTKLMEESLDILRYDVGGKFSSIHQYLALHSPNDAALHTAQEILLSEVENSSAMYKQCRQLNGFEVNDLLRSIYGHKKK